MDKDFLDDYANSELERIVALAADTSIKNDAPAQRLKRLYGVPAEKKVIYAESGGLANIDCFPPDVTLVIPIFPWSDAEDLMKHIGPPAILECLVNSGKVLPIIQNPKYYEGRPHLDFLFRAKAPSSFIRGVFAFADLLHLDPVFEFTKMGGPVLRDIYVLMDNCENNHQEWLANAMDDSRCWEYRYRHETLRDERFDGRFREGLLYRYASVAVCIGKHNADQIIRVFKPRKASDVLLHLHILFDHVICHGFGSDFVVRPATPGGNDFIVSQKTGITSRHEYPLSDDLTVSIPERETSYVRGLLAEEHFLREINFDRVTKESLPALQDQLRRQFETFNRKVERLKGMRYIRNRYRITLYAALIGAGWAGAGLPGILSGTGTGLILSSIADGISTWMERLEQRKLASYLINAPIGKMRMRNRTD